MELVAKRDSRTDGHTDVAVFCGAVNHVMHTLYLRKTTSSSFLRNVNFRSREMTRIFEKNIPGDAGKGPIPVPHYPLTHCS